MKKLKAAVVVAALVVFAICLYIFLLGNKVFSGSFESDPLSLYFLAKGIFCSLSLYISVCTLEVLSKLVHKSE